MNKNVITFNKNQKKEMHEYLNLFIDLNTSENKDKYQGKYEMLLTFNGEYFAFETIELFENEEGYKYIDENHEVRTIPYSNEYLTIEDDLIYNFDIPYSMHTFEIKGSKINEFIEQEYNKQEEKLRNELINEEK